MYSKTPKALAIASELLLKDFTNLKRYAIMDLEYPKLWTKVAFHLAIGEYKTSIATVKDSSHLVYDVRNLYAHTRLRKLMEKYGLARLP